MKELHVQLVILDDEDRLRHHHPACSASEEARLRGGLLAFFSCTLAPLLLSWREAARLAFPTLLPLG
ncbi:hypothetical protein, partial [Brevundimonas sp.]|uniref:hypothetical protein n=1 Tax=Brevundimonas sp. TaxID=1871086 RepID=UPI0027F7791E